jgi:hypothetical protein
VQISLSPGNGSVTFKYCILKTYMGIQCEYSYHLEVVVSVMFQPIHPGKRAPGTLWVMLGP